MNGLRPAVQPPRPVQGQLAVKAALVALWEALIAMTPKEAHQALTDRGVAAFLPGLDVPQVLSDLDHDRMRRAVLERR